MTEEPLAGYYKKRKKSNVFRVILKQVPNHGANIQRDYPIAYSLRDQYWDDKGKNSHPLRKEERNAYVAEYRAKRITHEEKAKYERGASDISGYYCLGCAKTFVLMGKAFGEAVVKIGEK